MKRLYVPTCLSARWSARMTSISSPKRVNGVAGRILFLVKSQVAPNHALTVFPAAACHAFRSAVGTPAPSLVFTRLLELPLEFFRFLPQKEPPNSQLCPSVDVEPVWKSHVCISQLWTKSSQKQTLNKSSQSQGGPEHENSAELWSLFTLFL